jgi:ATP-dependent 26S proteasome regulatory subunit
VSDVLERTLTGLRGALAVSPTNGPLWLQVAEILAELERDNEAAEAAREALRHLADGAERERAEGLLGRLAPAEGGPEPREGNVLRMVRGRREPEAGPTLFARPDRERVTFADVGGLDPVKEDIRMKVVLPYRRPDLFAAYGKKAGGGLLLYGPPGCGKTLLARATAGECDAAFLNVEIDQVLDMWYGESERKLSALFEEARRRAPAVLFLDEVEAIGGSRQQMRGRPGQTLVNQLLAELDGVAGKNDRLLVMAATNAPWFVDAALRRPGRFDRVVFVPPPDRAARLEVLRLHLRQRPAEPSLDLAALAEKTESFSGADLFDLVERAVEYPLREALRSGEVRPLSRADFASALALAKPSTLEWFQTARNYATFANTGGLYDDLVAYLGKRKS